MQLQKTLDGMVGKTFLFKSRTHKIIKTRSNDGNIQIVTDKDWLEISEKELKQFLPAAPEKDSSLVVLTKRDPTLKSLRTTLIETIEKVKVDKEYIDQAVVINNSIKTVIDMAKFDLETLKFANKIDQ